MLLEIKRFKYSISIFLKHTKEVGTMRISLNIEKSHLYILSFVLVIFTGVFVLAYGTNNPSEFGHTYTEIQGMPSPSTIWTSNNDGTGSGMDADRIDSQDITIRDMNTPSNPKICVNKGVCSSPQQTACTGTGTITKRLPGCTANQCASSCSSFCRSAQCSWSCNGDLYPECLGGTPAIGSEFCTQSTGGSCSDGNTCDCDCTSAGQNYQRESRTQQLYCATMTLT